jgi:hypothetical protein
MDPDPLVQWQEWTTAYLLGQDYFCDVSVSSLRRMRLSSELALKMPHLVSKNGKSGVGVLVGMPKLEVRREEVNIRGPQLGGTEGILVLENPTVNLNPATGTGKSAEDICLKIMGMLHLLQFGALINMYFEGDAMVPEHGYEGMIGYWVYPKGRLPQSTVDTVAQVGCTINAGMVTLTCSTGGAVIYYTLDQSFPGPGSLDASGRALATVYSGPFAQPPSGTTISFGAVAPGSGLYGSDVGQVTI